MLHAFRVIFLVVCAALGYAVGAEHKSALTGCGIAVGIGVCCVLLEWAFARRFIAVISTLMFGIVVGFVISYFVNSALSLIPGLGTPEPPFNAAPEVQRIYLQDVRAHMYRNFGVTFVCCFLAVLAILHSKDDFKFVIPFLELKREGRQGRPFIVDTSVIIDGRIAEIVETRIIDGQLIIPRFVLDELQSVADSEDRLKRNRGRRGLDILRRMQASKTVQVEVQDVTLQHMEGVDQKLIRVAKLLDGRLVTNDFNLNKVAQVQGVDVININDLANALRASLLPGEGVRIRVIRIGESPGQGIGYLEDGTMVVAEECANRVGQDVDLIVTNVRQTSAGRLIFSRPSTNDEPHPTPRI